MSLSELKKTIDKKEAVVCVVGLGYVGLPLAEHFSNHLNTVGFDIDDIRIEELKRENKCSKLFITSAPGDINKADIVIICVPTPVRKNKEPDLSYVKSASKMVAENMKKGSVVVYESTVYPGATEEECIPILEEVSGMEYGREFYAGYSPERINPGDDAHDIHRITKVVSGMNKEVGEVLKALYGFMTDVHMAPDIKTAEAAKVIENVQRDLNIALMNELSVIFNKIGLDTDEVLDAAATKWNFHRYSPGLVGGHCIPVDPYYLVKKAKELGYHPQVILAGRAINDHMPKHVAWETIKAMNRRGKALKGSSVLVMGLTYKENVPDTRESPVRGLIKELKEFGVEVYGHDPLLSDEDIEGFGAKPRGMDGSKVDCIVMTVAHRQFRGLSPGDLKEYMNENPVLIDVRGMFNREECERQSIEYVKL
ncbi:MAG: nucleotide sugar dehydrogenase [Thermoplasmata archaeon]